MAGFPQGLVWGVALTADLGAAAYRLSISSPRVVTVDGDIPVEVVPSAVVPVTAFGWAIAPDALTEVLLRRKRIRDGRTASIGRPAR